MGIIPARAGFTGPLQDAVAADPDHPRSRGVYETTALIAPQIAGSSPLARGLHIYLRPVVPRGGIIPARAGFTVRLNG